MFFGRKSRKELLREIKELKARINYGNRCNDFLRAELDFNTHNVDTVCASCITSGHGEQDFERAKEYICNEIVKELLPYIKFKNYLLVDSDMQETKHIGTIKVVRKERIETSI